MSDLDLDPPLYPAPGGRGVAVCAKPQSYRAEEHFLEGKPCVPFLTLGRGGDFSAVFSRFLGQMELGRSVGMG